MKIINRFISFLPLSYMLLMIIFSKYLKYFNINEEKTNCGNIAHGCGEIESYKYTNSLEAFFNSYYRGFRYIEIDLIVTHNKHVLGAHDLNLYKNYTNYKISQKFDLSYIKTAKLLNKYHSIYDYMIYNILKRFNNVIIVTDKITNFLLLRQYAVLINRLFVEIPSYKYYKICKKYGFINILVSIKTVKDLNALKSMILQNISIFGIVISSNIFYTYKNIITTLFNRNIKIFSTGITNRVDRIHAYCRYVTGFYID